MTTNWIFGWLLWSIVCLETAPVPPFSVEDCHPVFNEISTTMPLQGDVSFLEITFRGQCHDGDLMNTLNNYRMVVIDSKPRVWKRPTTIFYASFHSSSLRYVNEDLEARKPMRTGRNTVKEFVITRDENTNLDMFCPNPEKMTISLNMVPSEKFDGDRFFLPTQLSKPLTIEEQSHHPVVFLLYDTNSDEFRKTAARKGNKFSYVVKKTNNQRIVLNNMLHIDLDDIDYILKRTVDVLVVNRNETKNEDCFVRKLFKKLPPRVTFTRITPSRSSITTDRRIDFLSPISRCVYDTKVQWVETTPSPGHENVCTGQNMNGLRTEYGLAIRQELETSCPIVEPDEEEEVLPPNPAVVAEDRVDDPQTPPNPAVVAEEGVEHPQTTLNPAVAAGEEIEDQPTSSRACDNGANRHFESPQNSIYSDNGAYDEDNFEDYPPDKKRRLDVIEAETCTRVPERDILHNVLKAVSNRFYDVQQDVSKVQHGVNSLLDYATLKENRDIMRIKCDMITLHATIKDACINNHKNHLVKDGTAFGLSAKFVADKSRDSKFDFFKPTGQIPPSGTLPGIVCSVCQLYAPKTCITFNDAKVYRDEKELKNQMTYHVSRPTHQYSVQKLEAACKSVADEAVNKATIDNSHFFQRTANRFRIVYSAIRQNIPPERFDSYLSTMEQMVGDLGQHHRDHDGYVKMSELIFDVLHGSLINYLKKTVPYAPFFSLIVDSSTTPDGRHVLALNVRYSDDFGIAVTRPLALIDMEESETAEMLVNTIVEWFTEAGLKQQLANNLVSVITDSASVMVGEKGGLKAKMIEWIKKNRDVVGSRTEPITWQPCFAHRLETVLSAAYKTSGNVQKQRSFVTSFINAVSSFFGSTSHKRKELLKKLSSLNVANLLKLKKILKVRWTSSETEAIGSFLRNYHGLLMAFHHIATCETKDFDESAKKRSLAFLLVMKQPKFLSFIVFQHQLLSKIGHLSKQYQTETATVYETALKLDETAEEIKKMYEVSYWNEETKNILQKSGLKCITMNRQAQPLPITNVDCNLELFVGWKNRQDMINPSPVWLFFEPGDTENYKKDVLAYMFQGGDSTDENKELKKWMTATELKLTNAQDEEQKKTMKTLRSRTGDLLSTADVDLLNDLNMYNSFLGCDFQYMNKENRIKLLTTVINKITVELKPHQLLGCFKFFSLAYLSEMKDLSDQDAKTCRHLVYVHAQLQETPDELDNQILSVANKLNNPTAEITEAIELLKTNDQHLLLSMMIAKNHVFHLKTPVMKIFSFIQAHILSSATVERVFSITNHLYDSRRSSTKTSSWERYLIIYYNDMEFLPEDLSFRMAVLWVGDGHILVDSPQPTRGVSQKTALELQHISRLDAMIGRPQNEANFVTTYGPKPKT